MNKNTKMVWGVVIFIIIITISIFAARNNKKGVSSNENINTESELSAESNSNETAKSLTPATKTSTQTNTNTESVSISYKDALVQYADRRIQLGSGQQCNTTPNNVTYKNGTSIMIDNRSPESRIIKLGNTYTVSGYGFRIITLNSNTLPATWFLDCGTQKNVATILIQK